MQSWEGRACNRGRGEHAIVGWASMQSWEGRACNQAPLTWSDLEKGLERPLPAAESNDSVTIADSGDSIILGASGAGTEWDCGLWGFDHPGGEWGGYGVGLRTLGGRSS